MAGLVAGRRLPWIKLWIEGMAHEKVALLSDGQFRSWVLVLCAGAQQPVRWRFASAQHAADATGRPLKHILDLIDRRLLDLRDGEVWIHDYQRWQIGEHPVRAAWNAMRELVAPLIYSRDGYRCLLCGAGRPLTVDHEVAIVNGGTNDLSNLRTLCRPCNSRKGAH